MKQVFILLFFSLFILNDTNCQYIAAEPGFLGKKYTQNGVNLNTKRQFLSAVENNPSVHSTLKKSFTMGNIATGISSLGGFGVGFGLSSASRGNIENSGTIAAAGLGLIIIALPLAIISDSKVKSAINRYNEDYKPQDTGMNNSPTLNLQSTSNGIGLVMVF